MVAAARQETLRSRHWFLATSNANVTMSKQVNRRDARLERLTAEATVSETAAKA